MTIRTIFAATSIACLLSACGGDDSTPAPVTPPVTPPAAQPLALTILHINDHHSNLDGASTTLALAGADGTLKTVTVPMGGFARVKAAIDALAKDSPNVLKLHAGDAQTGTLYFNRAGATGEPDAAMMNTVCFDAFTLGNHEFDKGDTHLKSFIDLLHAGSCKTPALSANVTFGANSALAASRAPDYVKPSVVVERGGQKIGIVGLTIAGKTKSSSSPDADTVFEDELAAGQREVNRLRASGVNKIILMSHIGYTYDVELAPKFEGVDVIVGGDSHTLLGPTNMAAYRLSATAGGAYPTRLTGKDGKNVCVVQAWEYSRVVGELKVNFDANGDVTSCSGTPHVLIGDDLKIGTAAVSAADRTAMMADIAASGFLRVTAPDASATAVLAPFKEKVDVFNRTVVAVAPDELCSRRVPGGSATSTARWNDYGRSSAACNALGDVTRRGGDIQQIAAQAFLEIADKSYGGADLTLQSGGGVRVPLQGEVTAGKAIEVLPYGNMLWRVEITAPEIKAMLEDGMEATYGPTATTGPYPYAGGVRFDVDASQPKGNRISNLEIHNRTTDTWRLLNLSDTTTMYKLFVLSFNATGGDGYTSLAALPLSRRLDIGVLDADVFLEYIAAQSKNAAGLPILRKLDPSKFSTKSVKDPA
ncbi:bifunctional metallophosphatase/5'-nucleotidase [Pigmentiphaga aceris]|uniref:Bifunctional metallophosphatase/5'-nucleotidase n=1 Tax=Pigmentiphaga aceris TaxID=1940612 RepID=A0A5C0B3Q7_9BURK|nr:5'-nucleotidase C-terminal domain-containing protein [Pigmentiphaga aceris]QEI08476.1 bifunctional metallophosphatase/5'-nucleotidase [Pigmentiphaga aceris]